MASSVDLAGAGTLICLIAGTLTVLFLFLKPILTLSRFLLRSLCCSGLVFLCNLVTQAFSFSVGVNLATATVYGFCGIYGVVGCYLLRLLYG